MFATIFSTLVDFEPYPSLIVFSTGCNLRCPYCYNHDLIYGRTPTMTIEEVDHIINEYLPYIQGLVLSGGEPLYVQDLSFCEFVIQQRKKGLKIKLDSNLTLPVSTLLLNQLYGISFTVKPISYYKESYFDTMKKNLMLLSQLPWKEVRITAVDDTGIIDTLEVLKDYISGWKISIHNAIKPEHGILDESKVNLFNSSEEFLQFVDNVTDIVPVQEIRYVG